MLFMQESRQTDPVHVDRTEHQPALSSHQKFRKASVLVGRIAGVLSEVSTANFRKIIVVLETLLQHWVNDEEVHLAAEESPLVPREKTGNATGSSDSGALCAFMPVGSKEAAEIPCSTLPSNSAEACASMHKILKSYYHEHKPLYLLRHTKCLTARNQLKLQIVRTVQTHHLLSSPLLT